eukprot:TRINITY_DN78019_c0_g1_i1.p1 TRINITY_DN78019_c0_g1~~TRINITY_DN78019_c0_g1_i1.p1  ORF type:complete len:283 (-),score=34.47 TRINITY_DN78019_c0_g1_i1:15-863(-)
MDETGAGAFYAGQKPGTQYCMWSKQELPDDPCRPGIVVTSAAVDSRNIVKATFMTRNIPSQHLWFRLTPAAIDVNEPDGRTRHDGKLSDKEVEAGEFSFDANDYVRHKLRSDDVAFFLRVYSAEFIHQDSMGYEFGSSLQPLRCGERWTQDGKDWLVSCSHAPEAEGRPGHVACITLGGVEVGCFDVPPGEDPFGKWLWSSLRQHNGKPTGSRMRLVNNNGEIFYTEGPLQLCASLDHAPPLRDPEGLTGASDPKSLPKSAPKRRASRRSGTRTPSPSVRRR